MIIQRKLCYISITISLSITSYKGSRSLAAILKSRADAEVHSLLNNSISYVITFNQFNFEPISDVDSWNRKRKTFTESALSSYIDYKKFINIFEAGLDKSCLIIYNKCKLFCFEAIKPLD